MEARYKPGDRVRLTTNEDLLEENSIPRDFVGFTATISRISKNFNTEYGCPVYVGKIFDNCGERQDDMWSILEKQIVGLLEIDWKERTERRCNDA
jgi:hypothetical protein